VAQRVMVLRDGTVAGVVGAAEVSRREIVSMMVGRDIERDEKAARDEAVQRATDPASTPPALEVSNLSRSRAFEGVSFAVHPGEAVGLFGLLGAGHLAVTRAIFGAEPADEGEIRIHGSLVSIASPRQAARRGIGLVAEDRKTDGLVPAMSVADNLVLSHWPGVASAGVVSLRRQQQKAKEWVGRMGVRLKSGVRQPIATLSGGNQQKVLLARWLEAGVRILLLNEPTRGVDVGARADIYALLDELRRKGLAVVVCSSDLEEVLEVSDRILVFAKGKLVAEFDRGQADQVGVLAAATGQDNP
ncbi:MAG: ATP-binding cassette domain-containing protein, partial [Tepidisphaeraceae bacterium]